MTVIGNNSANNSNSLSTLNLTGSKGSDASAGLSNFLNIISMLSLPDENLDPVSKSELLIGSLGSEGEPSTIQLLQKFLDHAQAPLPLPNEVSINDTSVESVSQVLEFISKEVKNLPEFGLTYMAHANWKKPPFPMLLNFLGNFDENWGGIAKPSNIDQGEMTAPENMVMGMVEINGMIIQGRLKWMFRSHRNFPIEKFEKQFNSILNSLNKIEENIDDLDESISKDDIDTINDLLGNINL